MASETMESAVMMEVASIQRYVNEAFQVMEIWSQKDHAFISQRLDNIQRTLEEGDPGGE